MNDENELLEPLATEAGQEAIARAIRDISSLEYAVRAEQAASLASAKAGEASQSAIEASDAEDKAKDWATKTDTYVEQLIITIPPAQEGEEPTTETINLYSAKYYAALALDIYNNMSFDSVPTENSTNMVSSGTVYSALDLKADKSTTYTKTETDNLINTRLAELVASAPAALDTLQELATALGNDPNFATTIATQLGNKADKSTTYTKTEVDTALSNVQSTLTFDNTPTANSDNPVKSSGIKTALDSKQDTLTFDSTPTANSTNPVTSGGVYTALQNVNIDIDDEITEDSDNPVTSAAIYEALLNFTPSGDGDIGEVGFPRYTNPKDIIQELSLSTPYYVHSNGVIYTAPSNGYIEIIIAVELDGWSCYVNINNQNVSLCHYSDSGTKYTNYFYPVHKGDIIKIYSNESGQYDSLNRFRLYSFNFYYAQDNLLSEQMYSNVLYENSSGVDSGNITLKDDWSNYDFIDILLNLNIAAAAGNSLIVSVNYLNSIYNQSNFGLSISVLRADARMSLQPISYSGFSIVGKAGDIKLYKIVGYKMAKGGYSGIVSDARMTVKSGTFEFPSTIGGSGNNTLTIPFDSPMPDTNYKVFIIKRFSGTNWTNIEETVTEKTTNGFSLYIYNNASNPTAQKPKYDWIAIRPNSYTREGMVEDVLFSNASGVNSGTINLSGNISDYDLIAIETKRSSNNVRKRNIYTASSLLNGDNNDEVLISFNLESFTFNCHGDNTLVITWGSSNSPLIMKITGIKFGRYVSGVAVDTTVTQNSDAVVTSGAVYNALLNLPSGGGSGGGDIDILEIQLTDVTPISGFECKPQYLCNVADDIIMDKGSDGVVYKLNNLPAVVACNRLNGSNMRAVLLSTFEDAVKTYYNTTSDISSSSGSFLTDDGLTVYYGFGHGFGNKSSSGSKYPYVGNPTYAINKSLLDCAKLAASESGLKKSNSEEYLITSSTIQSQILNKKAIKFNDMVFWFAGTFQDSYIYSDVSQELDGNYARFLVLNSVNYSFEIKRARIQDVIGFDTTPTENSTNAITSGGVYAALQNIPSGSSITVDSTITQGGTNPVEGGAIYTALDGKADKSTTYTKTEVDTALASKGDVTTNTDQNITGTKTFVGSKKVGFKQSTTNDKLGFTLFGNTGTERGYLEFNPTNTVDGVTGLMTIGNYATSAAGLTQVGFRRYSNISGANGAYNLLTPLIADAKSPFSLTTTYTNFYLPLGFTDGTTTVKTAKSGLVDLSPLLASLEARIAALEGN